MIVLQGQGIVSGVVFGKLWFLKKDARRIAHRRITDPAAEIARYESAKEKAVAQLGELYEKALADVGESGAQLFEVHKM
ncbi:MAG: phosphoenolpyruvate--protein phosphotransferase, partial [Synergistaceae bacterium]|nr:phosphoenolpyruvate--protein phosphotransferase [Synergistaceae bacterium]